MKFIRLSLATIVVFTSLNTLGMKLSLTNLTKQLDSLASALGRGTGAGTSTGTGGGGERTSTPSTSTSGVKKPVQTKTTYHIRLNVEGYPVTKKGYAHLIRKWSGPFSTQSEAEAKLNAVKDELKLNPQIPNINAQLKNQKGKFIELSRATVLQQQFQNKETDKLLEKLTGSYEIIETKGELARALSIKKIFLTLDEFSNGNPIKTIQEATVWRSQEAERPDTPATEPGVGTGGASVGTEATTNRYQLMLGIEGTQGNNKFFIEQVYKKSGPYETLTMAKDRLKTTINVLQSQNSFGTIQATIDTIDKNKKTLNITKAFSPTAQAAVSVVPTGEYLIKRGLNKLDTASPITIEKVSMTINVLDSAGQSIETKPWEQVWKASSPGAGIGTSTGTSGTSIGTQKEDVGDFVIYKIIEGKSHLGDRNFELQLGFKKFGYSGKEDKDQQKAKAEKFLNSFPTTYLGDKPILAYIAKKEGNMITLERSTNEGAVPPNRRYQINSGAQNLESKDDAPLKINTVSFKLVDKDLDTNQEQEISTRVIWQ